jgi:hypothetical protein
MAPPRSLERTAILNALTFAIVAYGCTSCSEKPREEDWPVAKTEELAQAKPIEPPSTPATAPTPEAPAAEPEPSKFPRPGFSVFSIHDKVPICAFASEADRTLAPVSYKEAKKQTLRAGYSVTIGAYPSWCVNEACDARPSIQCWIEMQGKTIVVNTRWYGDHKDGSTCTENCRPVSAGCETPPLAAGTYTIQQGGESWKLRIPSVLRKPCFLPKE